jgi:type IV pilus assembly protein PilQ
MYPTFFKSNSYDVWDTTSTPPEISHQISKYSGPVSISYAISYLIENSKGRVVANPKIVVTNGEEAKIEVTKDYIESTETEMSTYTGGTYITRTYNIESDAGFTLTMTAFISPDGYVTMNIKPEYKTIVGQETDKDSAGNGYIAATLLSNRNLDLKNVRVKDGETLVLAGLINEEEQKTVGKVPILGDIPGIGAMFRSSSSTKTKSEMVIMLTPKIITDTEDAVGNTDTL